MTERGKEIVQKVVSRIAEVAPEGLGGWDRAWDIIEGPSDSFLDALSNWEETDTANTRSRLQSAADDFVRAWRTASEEWLNQKTQPPHRDYAVGAWGVDG